jgi:hypothetical protein
MSETDWPSGEENIDEEGRNPTQQRIDEEGASDEPATTGGETETEPSPHQGEEGQGLD